ncbi:MAG: hypothetical protein ABI461_14835, partial [Polyangiaceae bacterium]
MGRRIGFAAVGAFALLVVASCSSSSSDGANGADGGSGNVGEGGGSGSGGGGTGAGDEGGAPGAPASVASKARAITERLGGSHADHFLIGLGTDGDAAFTLGPALDVHYNYFVGLSTEGGWPTWNSNPDYLGVGVQSSESHG